MPRRKPSTGFSAALVLVIVMLLPAAYMGAYYAMVDRVFLEWGSIPNYRIEGDAVSAFFQPAHWLDRNVRPSYWD